MGFEPTTSYLEGRRSTAELHPHDRGSSLFLTNRLFCTLTVRKRSESFRRFCTVTTALLFFSRLACTITNPDPGPTRSGRVDSNHRPREPKSRALTGLRYAPNEKQYTLLSRQRQTVIHGPGTDLESEPRRPSGQLALILNDGLPLSSISVTATRPWSATLAIFSWKGWSGLSCTAWLPDRHQVR